MGQQFPRNAVIILRHVWDVGSVAFHAHFLGQRHQKIVAFTPQKIAANGHGSELWNFTEAFLSETIVLGS